MGTKEKQDIGRLTRRVLEQAEAEAQAILERARAEADEILEKAREEAAAREEELVRSGLRTVERARRRIISQAQLRLKGELLEKKAIILGDVLDEVRERLLAFRLDESYLKLVWRMIDGALRGEEARDEQVRLRLNRDDLERHRQELLRLLTNEFELSAGEVEFAEAELLGGAIVDLPARRLEVDISLDQLLLELRPQVERLVAERVFKEEEQAEEGEDD
ncbi:MAG: V-type ATP synthase subunit E [Candidatus Bipolaricaulia bacterium]